MAGKDDQDQHLTRFNRLPRPVRIVYARPRTFMSAAIGVVAFLLLPASLRLVTRQLIGWDVFIACYLLLAYTMILRGGVKYVRRNAVMQCNWSARAITAVRTSARRGRRNRMEG